MFVPASSDRRVNSMSSVRMFWILDRRWSPLPGAQAAPGAALEVPLGGHSADSSCSRIMQSFPPRAIVGYARELASFAKLRDLPGTDLRRFASVDALGHLFCSDLCWIGASAGGLVEIASAHGIRAASWFQSLGQDGCAFLNREVGSRYLEPSCGWRFVNFASAAALEETLRCDTRMAAPLSRIKTVMPIPPECPRDMVFDYEESVPQFVI
ncbi:unnamed protein product [Prorocentrum cordatum]|uniref:RES domain-containing protein n=1 Tax=Prorocentrum cordatum TaxID=2364126 RepID=A0ABN9X1I3_9DINO|nr:unnamed protein product [Polarella glacialis]